MDSAATLDRADTTQSVVDAPPPPSEIESESTDLDASFARWKASEEAKRVKPFGDKLVPMGMPESFSGDATRTDQASKMDELSKLAFDAFMILSGLILCPLTLMLFAFPFVIDSIDLQDLGPPPMS